MHYGKSAAIAVRASQAFHLETKPFTHALLDPNIRSSITSVFVFSPFRILSRSFRSDIYFTEGVFLFTVFQFLTVIFLDWPAIT